MRSHFQVRCVAKSGFLTEFCRRSESLSGAGKQSVGLKCAEGEVKTGETKLDFRLGFGFTCSLLACAIANGWSTSVACLVPATGMAIYTDWGILNPERYEPVGSQNERNPKVKEQVIEGKRLLVVEGELKDKQGQHCGLSYQVAYALERDKVEVDIAIKSARSFPTMNGFLATVINFSGVTEWFARIRKGWIFAEITSDKRVFQSAQTPLDDNLPTLGIANSRTGLAIVLTLKETTPADSLDNVIIHANPSGNGGLFLAWCDGIRVRKMGEGESWKVSVQLQFLRLDKMLPKWE